MPDETEVIPFAEGVHLDTAEGPKPIVEWGSEGAPPAIENEIEPEPEQEQQAPAPQVFEYEDGSSVTLEHPSLTGRGWRVSLDSGTGKPPEVFYGATKDEAMLNLAVGKLNATKKINELKREKLLGGNDEPEPKRESVQPRRLSPNDKFDLKAKLEDDPDTALEEWYQKRTGRLPEEVAHQAQQGEEANTDISAESILTEWVNETDDYVMDSRNRDAIFSWLIVNKLKGNPKKYTVESATYALFHNGFLNKKTLDQAWENLKDEDLVIVVAQEPEPIAPKPTTRPRAAYNIRSSQGGAVSKPIVTERPLTEAELNKLSDEEINKLYHGILEMNRTPEGKAKIAASIEQIRAKRQ